MIFETLILVYYKQDFKIIVKIDLFYYISNRVFFQLSKDKLLHFVMFFSKNLTLAKYNDKIYNKKLFAIIYCFKQ